MDYYIQHCFKEIIIVLSYTLYYAKRTYNNNSTHIYNACLLGLLLCFLVCVYPAAMLSLSGSTPLLCFSCPGLPRPWSVFLVRVYPVACLPCPGLRCCDVFLVRVYPVAMFFLVRVYPAVAPFSLSGFTPLRCFPCPGLPRCSVVSCPGLPRRCSVFLVRVYPVAMFSLSGSTPVLMHADSLLHGGNI